MYRFACLCCYRKPPPGIVELERMKRAAPKKQPPYEGLVYSPREPEVYDPPKEVKQHRSPTPVFVTVHRSTRRDVCVSRTGQSVVIEVPTSSYMYFNYELVSRT